MLCWGGMLSTMGRHHLVHVCVYKLASQLHFGLNMHAYTCIHRHNTLTHTHTHTHMCEWHTDQTHTHTHTERERGRERERETDR